MTSKHMKRCVHCEGWNELDKEECHICDSEEFGNPSLVHLEDGDWVEVDGWVEDEDDDDEGFDDEFDWEWID